MDTPSESLLLRQTDWTTLQLHLQWVYEGEVPEYGHGERPNPNLAAWLLLEGEVTVIPVDFPAVTAHEGDWLFLPGGTRKQNFSEQARLLSISWVAKWPDGRNVFGPGLPLLLRAAEAPGLESEARKLLAYKNKYFVHESEHFPLSRGMCRLSALTFFEGEKMIMDWFCQVIRALTSRGVQPQAHEITDSRMLLALETLESLPLPLMPGISEIAMRSGLSVSQLNRLFVRHMGHTPLAHLQNRKLMEARNMLSHGTETIKEIAYHLGFPSPEAFYNWFRDRQGCGPKEFRKTEG